MAVQPSRPGFKGGLVATLAMSLLMGTAFLTGISPLPQPVPAALTALVFGTLLPQAGILVLGVLLHFIYGGIAAATLTSLLPEAGWKESLGLSVVLWLIMGLVALPLAGWGLFGTAETPTIAMATLVPHLVYGATLGWYLERQDS